MNYKQYPYDIVDIKTAEDPKDAMRCNLLAGTTYYFRGYRNTYDGVQVAPQAVVNVAHKRMGKLLAEKYSQLAQNAPKSIETFEDARRLARTLIEYNRVFFANQVRVADALKDITTDYAFLRLEQRQFDEWAKELDTTLYLNGQFPYSIDKEMYEEVIDFLWRGPEWHEGYSPELYKYDNDRADDLACDLRHAAPLCPSCNKPMFKRQQALDQSGRNVDVCSHCVSCEFDHYYFSYYRDRYIAAQDCINVVTDPVDMQSDNYDVDHVAYLDEYVLFKDPTGTHEGLIPIDKVYDFDRYFEEEVA